MDTIKSSTGHKGKAYYLDIGEGERIA